MGEDAYQSWPRWQLHKIVRAAVIIGVGETSVWVQPAFAIRVEFVPNEAGMLKHAEIGGFAVIDDNGFRSILPRKAFEEGYRSLGTPPALLMSSDNPDGWKLELLLEQIWQELRVKNQRLQNELTGSDPKSRIARAVYDNNWLIMRMLRRAVDHQEDSLRLRTAIRPDPGPRGFPRVGAGSSPS